uniref:Anoctamin n=1 Tax=Mesocestoides corti TaxID=53468 RepID=A0A5K3G0G8_MESCO
MFRVEALATRQHVHLVALLFLQHLMTILVTRQIMGNLKEVFLPLGQTRIRQVYLSLRADGFALLKREDDATAPPPQVFTTSSDVDDGENSLEGSSTRMRRNADAKVHRDIGFTRAEQEEIMPKYDDATDDYLEMFIQFGFVSMFTCAFPICGLLAFLNNLLEIRSDAFKLLTNFQRPFAETATGIGVWERAFDIVSYVAISVNIGLIGVSGSLQDVFPGLTPYQHALLLISIEHILFVLRFGLSHVVPPVPLALETSIAILEHKRREALRTVEREGRKEARKVSEGNDSQASYEYPEYQNSDIDTP